jgi:hypothetical protein
MSAASVSSPPSIAENSSPLAAPTANQIDNAEPPAPELLASLRPLEFNSTSVESNVLPGNRLLADGLEYAHFPYTARQKFHLFIKDIYDPFAFAGEQFDALYNQAQGNPSDFGSGMQGYGLRLAAIYATDTTGEFFGTFLFPSILHTDPRYFRLGRGGFFHRAGYALTRILIVRKDDGGETFNTARWLTGFATTAVSDSYYPHRDRNMYGVMHHAAVNIGFDALDELFREFWPDIAHRLHVPAFVVRRTADPYFPDQQTKP